MYALKSRDWCMSLHVEKLNLLYANGTCSMYTLKSKDWYIKSLNISTESVYILCQSKAFDSLHMNKSVFR